MSKTCLNCDTALYDAYCSGCGQPADTHRISFKHFIFHDVLHGTFHLERGILFTAREALLRPGKAALDYIAGKRKRYYNVFYLILITFGILLFLRHFYDEIYLNLGRTIEPKKPYVNDASRRLDEIFAQKSKIIIFLFVPIAALNSMLLFRRKKLNLSEHAIIAGMILLGMLLLSATGHLIFYLDFIREFSDGTSAFLSWTVTALVIFEIAYGYWNAFASDYSRWGVGFRIVLFFALLAFELLLMLFLLIGWLTHWKYGLITIAPFS